MRIFPRSLYINVIVNVFATSFVMLLIVGWLIFTQATFMTETLIKENLLEQAKKIASFIEYDWKGSFDLDLPKRYEKYYADPSNSHQYAVLGSGGKILFSSEHFKKENIEKTLKEGGKHYFNFTTKKGEYYAGLKYDYLFDGKIYPVYVIELEEEFSKVLMVLKDDFLNKVKHFGLPLLLMQTIMIILIFRSALKPVLRASEDAANLKYDNLSFRLDEKRMPAEILPLIKSVNNGLSRLEDSAESQKLFIANAAHELRTPIAILKTRLASLDDGNISRQLNQDLRNINHLIGQMLDITRLDLAETTTLSSQINLNHAASRACEDIGPLFIEQNKELSLEKSDEEEMIIGNDDMIYRAVLNLLENALKHGPDNKPVEVIVKDHTITVRDYGNPISSEFKDRIFERFEKLPQSSGTQGSGLGLAIVKKVAELHNGAIQITPRENGNDFVLSFSNE